MSLVTKSAASISTIQIVSLPSPNRTRVCLHQAPTGWGRHVWCIERSHGALLHLNSLHVICPPTPGPQNVASAPLSLRGAASSSYLARQEDGASGGGIGREWVSTDRACGWWYSLANENEVPGGRNRECTVHAQALFVTRARCNFTATAKSGDMFLKTPITQMWSVVHLAVSIPEPRASRMVALSGNRNIKKQPNIPLAPPHPGPSSKAVAFDELTAIWNRRVASFPAKPYPNP